MGALLLWCIHCLDASRLTESHVDEAPFGGSQMIQIKAHADANQLKAQQWLEKFKAGLESGGGEDSVTVIHGVYQFTIHDFKFFVDVNNGAVSAGEGEAEAPVDVAIEIGDEDFADMVAGKLIPR